MVVIGIGAIIIFSLLLDKDPSRLLTGLGASAAILMLVFKDTIMGLVAGVACAKAVAGASNGRFTLI